MNSPVDTLKGWFYNLPRNQQTEVIEFLYDGPVLLQEGLYCGPNPRFVRKGLFCGSAPNIYAQNVIATNKCPTCGRSY